MLLYHFLQQQLPGYPKSQQRSLFFIPICQCYIYLPLGWWIAFGQHKIHGELLWYGEKLGSTIVSCHKLFIATDWCSAEYFWDFRVNHKAVSTENCLSPKGLFPHPSKMTHSQTIFWLACRLSKVTFPSSELTANMSCRWTNAGHFVESWDSWSLLQQNWLSYLTTHNHTLKICIFLFVCTLTCMCQFMCITRVQKPAEARRGCQRPGAGVTRL